MSNNRLIEQNNQQNILLSLVKHDGKTMLYFLFLFLCQFLLIDCLNTSACSTYLFRMDIDQSTNHEFVRPCPVVEPCQCICEIETKRLWINCFHRQLQTFPQFQIIETNNTILEWNIDLAFNQFDNLIQTKWLPWNMHVHYLIFSGSLAYDLIVHLNLTHRHLIDIWPDDKHLSVIHDELFDDDDDDDQQTRLLTELTDRLNNRSKSIENFALTFNSAHSSISIVYLDHNSLNSVPIDALFNATHLYELYLSYNSIETLPAYAFGFSHRLTRLDLSHNRIYSIDHYTFHRHPKAFAGPFLIDYLDLSHNQLANLTTNLFSYLVNLRLLKLEHNQIRHLSAHIWTGLYRLKYLDLSHNFIENFTQVFYSSYLNELNHLKLTSNNLSQIGSCEFLSLKSLNKLNLSKFSFIKFFFSTHVYLYSIQMEIICLILIHVPSMVFHVKYDVRPYMFIFVPINFKLSIHVHSMIFNIQQYTSKTIHLYAIVH